VSTFYLNNSYLRDAPAGLSKKKPLISYIYLSIFGPHIRFEKFVKRHITTFTEMLAQPIWMRANRVRDGWSKLDVRTLDIKDIL